MVMTVTDILNMWNDLGVFSYVIPFLLVFALVFALLQKTGILGDNKVIESIVAVAIGLLALQFDYVSTFFATIFPRFGIGISVFLVLLIFVGFFFNLSEDGDKKKLQAIGWIVGVGIIVWALTSWSDWTTRGLGFYWWISDYFWPLAILGALVGIIIWAVNSGKESKPNREGGTH